MQQAPTTEREAAEDVFFGQLVMNWARWFVIAAATVLVVLTAEQTGDLVLGIWPIVGLMALNFYLHGRRLAERPANRTLITLASVVDVLVITTVVFAGLGTGQRGFESPFFVAYYPVVLAFAFVMPPRVSFVYTAAALVAYAGASGFAGPGDIDSAAAEALTARLITLAAMGGLGTYFWRMQRDRRRAALGPAAAADPERAGS